MPNNIGYFVCAGWGIVGQGVQDSWNISGVSRSGVGTYVIALNTGSDGIVTGRTTGLVVSGISGPYKIDGVFSGSSNIVLSVYSLASGTLADPPNGTNIRLAAWQ